MTGQMSPMKRSGFWKVKRVFFVTPQVLEKDIQSGDSLISLFYIVHSLSLFPMLKSLRCVETRNYYINFFSNIYLPSQIEKMN